MKIGSFDTEDKVMIIAEIGNNHEGDFDLACQLVIEAAKAGVDAVKFQTFRTEHYCSRFNEERFAKLRRFEFSFEQFTKLKQLADDNGLMFLSTPFDLISAEFLNTIAPAIKISSGDNAFFPLLEKVAGFNKPIIMSTGFTDLPILQKSVAQIEACWQKNNVAPGLALLHCVAAYPVSPEDANLSAIRTLMNEFNCTPGYSDHALGIENCVLAVAVGARILEKHFTVDKNYSDFKDHQLSADPPEMKQLVQKVRETETLLGSGIKRLCPYETRDVPLVTRAIVSTRKMPAGTVIGRDDITWVRSAGEGLRPGMEEEILGKTLKRDLANGEAIQPDDIG